MSKILDELNEYKESCLGDNGYVIEGKAEDLIFKAIEEIEYYKTLYKESEDNTNKWIKKYSDESIEKTKYRCAFEVLFESVTKK